jgi:UDP-N-acetylglucosamine transferase subunit ALG13
MIFLAVGTQFPFDRLVMALDECLDTGLIDEEIFGQVGETSYRPRNFRWSPFLEKKEFDRKIETATKIIGHAGIGIIKTALDNNKPMLVMPRLRMYREVVHDHQVEIAKKFEELGYLLAAYNVQELFEKIRMLKNFVPQKRESQVDSVVQRISEFLQQTNDYTQ